MKRNIFCLIISFNAFFCCAQKSEANLRIEQISSNYPIIVRYDSTTERIFRVHIQLAYRIQNISDKKIRVYYQAYYYGNKVYARPSEKGWDSLFLMDTEVNGKQIRLPALFTIDSLQVGIYAGLTAHTIRKTDTLQSFWNSYIPEDKTCRKDTFHIGTIKDFKAKHPHILERMMENDSVQFWYRTFWTKEDGVPCYLPVEIK